MKFYHKIRFKITFGVVLIVLILLVGLGYSILIDQRRQIMDSLRSNGEQVMTIIAKNSVDAIRFYNYLYLEELCITVEQSHGVAFCEIYDTQENSLIQKSTMETTTLKKERKTGINILILELPILDSKTNHLGKVELGFYLDDLQKELKSTTIKLIIVFTIVILLVALSLNVFLSQLFITPVLNISHVAGLLARKKFVNVDIKPRQDEIGELVKNFDIMSDNLKENFAKIEKQNQELKQSENKFYQVFKLSPNAFSITRISDGAILEINRGFTEIFGYSNQDVKGKKSIEFNIWPSESERKRVLEKLITERKLKNEETQYKTKDSKIFDAYVSSVIIEINNEQVILSEVMDITQHKKAEEQLNLSNMRYQTIFQNSPIPLWEEDFTEVYQYLDELRAKNVYDFREYIKSNPSFLERCSQKVKILDVNQAVLKLHDAKTKEDLLGNLATIFTKTSYETFKEEIIALSKGFLDFESEGEVKTLSGERKAIFLKMTIDKEHNDSFRSLIATIDITDRKQMEERLKQAQKMESIGSLAGGIAHDFNNLLFPIIGMSEMLLDDLPQNSLEYENAQEIFNAGKRAGDLVKQILAFSRQSEHKMTPVRIQNILKEVLKLSHSTIPSNIKILQNIQQNCGLVMADSTQIHQIAMNLITNASHAVEDQNGVINIELKELTLKKDDLPDSELQPGPHIRLSVSDNGGGMNQSIQKKIFDPYFTTKEKGKGTGLGLAVVYGIMQEHKGDIKVYSEEGKGSTFNVYLPLMKTNATPVLDNRSSKLQTGTEKILLVDDEISVAKLEGQMLSRLGYQVTEQTSSVDALNRFKTNPEHFDLVISDMTMPNMTGDQLAKEILSIEPDMPIIICTGFSERVNKEQAEVIGVKGFLMKPVGKYDMAHMVRNVLDKAKNL